MAGRYLKHALALLRHPVKSIMVLVWFTIGMRIRARIRLSAILGVELDPQDRNLAFARKICEAFEKKTEDNRGVYMAEIEGWEEKPLISIVMPVYNTDPGFLREAIHSITAQFYPNWELCIADDASTDPAIRQILEQVCAGDARVRVVYREQNGHISLASNSAIEIADGEFVALMDHDDRLSKDALYWVAREIRNHPDVDLVYSDEDKIRADGGLSGPHFKPDWNEELFLTQNYINHLSVFRRDLLIEAGGLRAGYEGSQDHDLILRIVARTSPEKIRHIPRVLYHWRVFAGSGSFSQSFLSRAIDARRRAVRDYLADKYPGQNITVEDGPHDCNRIRYPLPDMAPRVSILIPTRDRLDYLKACIQSIEEKTDYTNYEIIIINNDSKEPQTLQYFQECAATDRISVIDYSGPFNFSAMNNLAAERASGTVLALVNNDIEVISEDWLSEMVSNAVRPEVGAVGAKLHYGNDSIQHAGVILNARGVAFHAFHTYPSDHKGYQLRLKLPQYISAVTAACLVVEKEKYLEAGGFDSDNLPVAYNDVDFCLKLLQRGYKNLFTPYAELYHHESVTRGSDIGLANERRLKREANFMREKWQSELSRDAHYNPNFSPDTGQFFYDNTLSR